MEGPEQEFESSADVLTAPDALADMSPPPARLVSLAIPHTPWINSRARSFARLRSQLETAGAPPCAVFADPESCESWARKVWRWHAEQDVRWCLTLQDDVYTAPRFWPKLGAMLRSLPDNAELVALTSTHPMAPEIARRGQRWYITDGGIIGWAWVMRRDTLREFLGWLGPKRHFKCEDSMMNEFLSETGRVAWNPVPTIVDHDTSLDSTYANDEHAFRRPQATWRDYLPGALEDESWWKPGGSVVQLPTPSPRVCWMCLEESVAAYSPYTGCGIGKQCIGRIIGTLL